MTIDLAAPVAAGSRCTGAVLTASPLAPVATPAATVQLLQLLPATAAELAWARVHGSAALVERWRNHHVDLLDLTRSPVPLAPPEARS
jgi:hypothetical protein